jgi:uncharacterized membrane protein YdjX (TVP38/TMEM64 family)
MAASRARIAENGRRSRYSDRSGGGRLDGDLRPEVTRARRADKGEVDAMMKKPHGPPGSTRRARSARLIVIAVLIVLAVSLFFVLPVDELLRAFTEWSQQYRLIGGVALIGLYVVATVAGVPGLILTLAAGFLFGVVWGTVVVSAGSVLGATAAFLVGRFVARDWVAERIGPSDRVRAIDRAVGRSGFKIVLLTRLSPVFPFNLLNYLFGLTDVRVRDYVLASWIGMLPATVLYVSLGTTIQNTAQLVAGEFDGGVGQLVLLWGGLAAALVVAALVARIAQRAISDEIPEATQFNEAPAGPDGASGRG